MLQSFTLSVTTSLSWIVICCSPAFGVSFLDLSTQLCVCVRVLIRAPNLLSFKRVPSPPSWCFRGYFHPTLHQLRGYHSVFRAASPSQAKSEDSKSYFEYSIWILTVKWNACGFSQYDNFQNQKTTMLEKIGYITEMTAWHFFTKVTWVVPVSDEGENQADTSQFRGSVSRTGQTWRGSISVLVRQRRANRALLGALVI